MEQKSTPIPIFPTMDLTPSLCLPSLEKIDWANIQDEDEGDDKRYIARSTQKASLPVIHKEEQAKTSGGLKASKNRFAIPGLEQDDYEEELSPEIEKPKESTLKAMLAASNLVQFVRFLPVFAL